MGINEMIYDNPENLSGIEILSRMNSFGSGINRNKRNQTLLEYSTELISKDEWIKKYCDDKRN
jgi:hypothetical protein